MVCASRDTRNLLTAPELTRFNASQPLVRFAGMLSKGEDVLVQVSGGSELALKPGLNIIGGMQPRGPKDVIDGAMPGISIDADIGIPLVDGEGVFIADMELLVCMVISLVEPMAADLISICEVTDLSMFMSLSICFAMGIVITDEEVWSISP